MNSGVAVIMKWVKVTTKVKDCDGDRVSLRCERDEGAKASQSARVRHLESRASLSPIDQCSTPSTLSTL